MRACISLPLQYGLSDLLAHLDVMHPASGEAGPRIVMVRGHARMHIYMHALNHSRQREPCV